MIVKQCSISGMRSDGTSCLMSFIRTCVKRDSTKLTSRFVERSRIFWIFYMKSVELIMCDSDFSVTGCSVWLGSEISCM